MITKHESIKWAAAAAVVVVDDVMVMVAVDVDVIVIISDRYLPVVLVRFLILSFLLIYFLTRLLLDLSIYFIQNWPVPFPDFSFLVHFML